MGQPRHRGRECGSDVVGMGHAPEGEYRTPPGKRVVVQIDFHGAATGTYWLVLEQPEPSVCMWDPGFEVDLFVATDTLAIHRAWMGMTSFAECVDSGLIELDGLAAYVKAFPGWFKLSVFADVKPVVNSR